MPDSYSSELLETLLRVSLTGLILFRPVYAPTNGAEIIDLAYVQLNPAAQQMLHLPERPADTFLTLYPHAKAAGIFDFYRTAFETGEAGRLNVNYQHDGLDNYFQLRVDRSGELLVVSFTDTADHGRTEVEQALRESQAREQAARADAERQRQQLHNIFMQAPALICIFEGPEHVFSLVNPSYQQLVGERPLLGMPIAEAMPELAGQPIFGLLDEVYRTGETFRAYEMLVQLDHDNSGSLGENYYNFIYQATRGLAGEIEGILVFAYAVTPQVRARHQVQDLNEELAAANEELHAANEEIRASIAELQLSEQALLELNNKLENRVAERTRELQVSLHETRQQQEQLRTQQGLLRQILGQVPAAIATLDGPEHRCSFFNAPYQALSGNQTQLGLAAAEVFPEVVQKGFIGLLDRVYATGQPVIGTETRTQVYNPATNQPEQRYLDYSYQPLTDGRGQMQGILVFILDVTDKVHAQQQAIALQAEVLAAAQRQAQEREAFYQVFEQTPASIALLRGPEHRVEYYNPAYQQLFPGRAMHGRTIAETQPDAAAQGFVALLDNVYQTGETFYGDELPLVIEQPNGQPPRDTYFNFTYQPYREGRQITGISVFAIDVTGQVLARQQREAMQQQLRAIFEQAPVAICVFRGAQHIFEVVNAPMAELLGRPLSELVNRPVFQALPELKSQEIGTLLDRVRETGVPFVAQEMVVRLARHGADGQGYYNFVYHPLRDDQGEMTGVTCVVIEVTEQVRARQQVEQSSYQVQELNEELAAINEELQAANEELSDTNTQLTRTNVDLDNFIYTASHDLRAPIANIEGLLHALGEHLPDATTADSQVMPILQMMQGALERFQTTIDYLTDITKLQKESLQPAQAVDLAATIEAVRLDLAPLLTSTGAQLEVDVTECPTIAFSQKNLRSLVYNLLSNALKYRAPDRAPQVRLCCTAAGNCSVLTVQDNGLGLDAQQQGRLFGMFQRLHDHVEGTGIGLYMVKRMVENVGGSIRVQSQLGVGSTFTVSFPR